MRAELKRRQLAARKEVATLKRQINRLRRAAKRHAQLMMKYSQKHLFDYFAQHYYDTVLRWNSYYQMKTLKG